MNLLRKPAQHMPRPAARAAPQAREPPGIAPAIPRDRRRRGCPPGSQPPPVAPRRPLPLRPACCRQPWLSSMFPRPMGAAGPAAHLHAEPWEQRRAARIRADPFIITYGVLFSFLGCCCSSCCCCWPCGVPGTQGIELCGHIPQRATMQFNLTVQSVVIQRLPSLFSCGVVLGQQCLTRIASGRFGAVPAGDHARHFRDSVGA